MRHLSGLLALAVQLAFAATIALIGAGCTSAKPAVVRVPIEVVVVRYVPISPDLTDECPVERPVNRTVREALRVNRARRGAIVGCANGDKAAIRSVQGTEVPK